MSGGSQRHVVFVLQVGCPHGRRHRYEMDVPVAFVAFDVLWHDDELLTRPPYADRRRHVEELRWRVRPGAPPPPTRALGLSYSQPASNLALRGGGQAPRESVPVWGAVS